MAQRFEHCRLVDTKIEYLGRAGLFEDKKDKSGSETKAWDCLEKDGWELVAVVSGRRPPVAYFKRPVGSG